MCTRHGTWLVPVISMVFLVAIPASAQETEEAAQVNEEAVEATEEAAEAVTEAVEVEQEEEQEAVEATEEAAEAVTEAVEVEQEAEQEDAEAETEAEQEAVEAEQEAEREDAEAETEAEQEAVEAEQEAEQEAVEAETEAEQEAVEAEQEAEQEGVEAGTEGEAVEEETEAEDEDVPELEGDATDEEFEEGDDLADEGEVPEDGPETILPESAHVRVGRISCARGELAPSPIGEQVRSRGAWIRRCYAAALERNDDTAGDIVIRGNAGPHGHIHGLRVQANTTGDPELAQCVRRAVDSLQVPPRPRHHRRVRAGHFRIPIRFWTE